MRPQVSRHCHRNGFKMKARKKQGLSHSSVDIICPPVLHYLSLQATVTSVLQATSFPGKWQIIVPSVHHEWLKARLPVDPQLQIMRTPEKFSFFQVINLALKDSKSDYCVILHDDILLDSGWLEPLIRELHTHPETGIVGAEFRNYNHTLQHGGIVIDRTLSPALVGSRLFQEPIPHKERRRVDAISSVCMAMRTEEFRKIGAFNDKYMLRYADTDLCLRYEKQGQQSICLGYCAGVHWDISPSTESASRIQDDLTTFHQSHPRLLQSDFSLFYEEHHKGVPRLKFCIKMCCDERQSQTWGDIFYAEYLCRELAAAGHECMIHYFHEWDFDDSDADVVIHLHGPYFYAPKPGPVNLLWMISHPNTVGKEELELYDGVCVASRPHAAYLRKVLATPVFELLQATHPLVHKPVDVQKDIDVAFIGGNGGMTRPPIRQMVSWLLPENPQEMSRYNIAIYGVGWEKVINEHYFKGHIHHHEQNRVYSRAKIVLNDHLADMSVCGFVNDRTYTVIASGAILVSDEVVDLENILDVPQANDRQSLHEIIEDIFARQDFYREKARKNRDIVLRDFTFAKRVREIEGILERVDSPELRARLAKPAFGVWADRRRA